MKKPVIEKIKSRGYWRINFEPLVFDKKLKTLKDCMDVVENGRVELRGWDYPHFPRRKGDDTGLEVGDKFYEGWVDWFNHIEFWRMYQSGQFLHYFAVREDWSEYDGWGITTNRNIKPGEFLNITGEVTYELTEIFEFLSRLAKNGIYNEGVQVSISLNHTKGRKLAVMDPRRAPLFDEYKTSLDNIQFVKKFTGDEILINPKDLALEAILYIFDRFGWHNPPIGVLKSDQENLLKRNI
jgi:hypothetical protein